MGVHITFVRSITLDSWSVAQLRNFKMGGNLAFEEFCKAQGVTGFTDAKQKYTSRHAIAYKERLQRLCDEDARRYPDSIVLDSNEVVEAAVVDQDLFNDWKVDSAVAPVAPVMTGTNILRPSKKGLGAKKATKVIDFAEAERLAKQEEQRRTLREEEEARRKEQERNANPIASLGNAGFSSRLAFNDSSDNDVERLGMGRLGFGFDASSSNKAAGGFGQTDATPAEATAASAGDVSKRFGNAKAVSSDMYFGRGAHDAMDQEDKQRLSQFQGKAGFGSSDYYGRDERGSSDSRNADGIMHGFSDSARDFASRFADQASEDLENVKRLVAAGGSKLSEYLADLQKK